MLCCHLLCQGYQSAGAQLLQASKRFACDYFLQYAVRGELFLKAAELQAQGKEIIFTNGAFPLQVVLNAIASIQHSRDQWTQIWKHCRPLQYSVVCSGCAEGSSINVVTFIQSVVTLTQLIKQH
jgi:hypothetical protein